MIFIGLGPSPLHREGNRSGDTPSQRERSLRQYTLCGRVFLGDLLLPEGTRAPGAACVELHGETAPHHAPDESTKFPHKPCIGP